MSNDPNTDYNIWLEEHLFIDRLEFINKDGIKYVDEKNKIFSQEEFDDTQWESRSIGEISEIFKKRSVNLNLNGPFHNTHNDFDGIVWIRKDFELKVPGTPLLFRWMEYKAGKVEGGAGAAERSFTRGPE